MIGAYKEAIKIAGYFSRKSQKQTVVFPFLQLLRQQNLKEIILLLVVYHSFNFYILFAFCVRHHCIFPNSQVPAVEVDGLSRLDAVKDNRGVSREDHCLGGASDILDLGDMAVQPRLQDDPVAVRDEILRQTHDRRRFWGCGRQGWFGCRIFTLHLNFVQSNHGDNASYGEDGRDDKGDAYSLALDDQFGHGGRCVL